MEEPRREYLEPGLIIRSDDPQVAELAAALVTGRNGAPEKAAALFYWVRDNIQYNPYAPFFLPEHYWPVSTLKRGFGYCVQKSALLAALARQAGLPARLVFADIINHRFSEKLLAYMGTNLFVYHGYVEMFVEGKWVRCTPSFERPLCDKLDIYPVEFDGRADAVLHPLDRRGRPHIEYVRHIGVAADVPLEDILAAWERTYSKERVEEWKAAFLAGRADPGLRPD
ncbi:MAG: transglutaminase family protein [Thermodesulfobacteriota bacterium]